MYASDQYCTDGTSLAMKSGQQDTLYVSDKQASTARPDVWNLVGGVRQFHTPNLVRA